MSSNKEEETFVLIGAGLPRTGTMSLKFALEIILPGKCHHMIDAMQFHSEDWRDIFSGKMTDEEFKTFFSSNYAAAVDAPFCVEYKRAMRLFPNAKVLLSVRAPEGWVKSVKATVLEAMDFSFPYTIFSMLGLFSSYIGSRPSVLIEAFTKTEFDLKWKKEIKEGRGVEYYKEWVQDVEDHVPKERLLKFNVREGWGPLCKFLSVPEPEIPFPNVNSTAQFQGRIGDRKRKSWLILYELLTLPVLGYFCYKQWRN